MEQVETKKDVILPRKSYSVEFFVGMFVVTGLACLSYLAVNIAKMNFLNAGFYELTAEFDNIAGLDGGAPVEIAGVPIGEVTKIELKDTVAIVYMKIRDDVTLRADDMAAIRTKGIIGERYIKIAPGGSSDHVAPGGKVNDTESAVEFEEIIGKLIHRME